MKKSIALSTILLTCIFQIFSNPGANITRTFLSGRTKLAAIATTAFGLVYYGEYTCSKSTHHKELDALFRVGARIFGLFEKAG